MKYLVTSGTVYDIAGLAMIQGCIIGMKMFDPDAVVKPIVPWQHDAKNPICSTFRYPDQYSEAIRWADAILDIGGMHTGKGAVEFIDAASKRDIPFIWMSQSYYRKGKKIPKYHMNKNSFVVARGKRSCEIIKTITGKYPPNAADLSFLIDPVPMKNGNKYITGFNTHFNKPIEPMYKLIKKLPKPVQIQMKANRKTPELPSGIWEQELPIPRIVMPMPNEMFGLIANLKTLHTARYHTAVGAVMAGFTRDRIKLYITYTPKYEDLLDLCGTSKANLKKSALVSCEYVRDILKGSGKWN